MYSVTAHTGCRWWNESPHEVDKVRAGISSQFYSETCQWNGGKSLSIFPVPKHEWMQRCSCCHVFEWKHTHTQRKVILERIWQQASSARLCITVFWTNSWPLQLVGSEMLCVMCGNNKQVSSRIFSIRDSRAAEYIKIILLKVWLRSSNYCVFMMRNESVQLSKKTKISQIYRYRNTRSTSRISYSFLMSWLQP